MDQFVKISQKLVQFMQAQVHLSKHGNKQFIQITDIAGSIPYEIPE